MMKSIKVTLDVTEHFRKSIESGQDHYAFGKLLDGCGADSPHVIAGKNRIEFEMWQDGEDSLRYHLANSPQFQGHILNITTTPCP